MEQPRQQPDWDEVARQPRDDAEFALVVEQVRRAITRWPCEQALLEVRHLWGSAAKLAVGLIANGLLEIEARRARSKA